jgi:hypothetical protein
VHACARARMCVCVCVCERERETLCHPYAVSSLGITKCFKQLYRKHLVQKAVCLMDSGKDVKMKIHVLQAHGGGGVISAWVLK